ncbi:MAG: NADH-quinone oxidoreductase subunit N [Deltaproteobacteria bacterium]|nr:NADH-quinone oxidoreductase subunit N [Deltaproteobacteria bacterium]
MTFGMCLMASATNVLMLYIGIETVSIISFVMAGLKRDDARSNEASLKYLIFGAVASAIMIYGFSLIYGVTGSLNYGDIAKALIEGGGEPKWAILLSMVMVYVGLAYKISAFPLHFWTPDVYEGAPTPVTAFFSIAPKAAGFGAAIRFFLCVLSTPGEAGVWTPMALGHGAWTQAIAVLSVLTMLVGNLSAIGQKNVKRILAYSSVAHVGYLLMGFVSANAFGVTAVLFYLVAYCLMNLGAFWVVGLVADRKKSEDLEAFKGVGWEDPFLGVTMAIFLFSLTGIPMFSGFVGKFLLFSNVVQTPGFLWLAVIGVLNSVVSLFYYANILKAMWLDKPDTVVEAPVSSVHRIALAVLAIPTMVLGLYFEPILKVTQSLVATFR